MLNIYNNLFCFAISGVGAWVMLRFAAAAATKLDFLASCLCFAGLIGMSLVFCQQIGFAEHQPGILLPAAWKCSVGIGAIIALVAGHLIKCSAKPALLLFPVAFIVYEIARQASVASILPTSNLNSFHHAAFVFLSLWAGLSGQVWAGSWKTMKGQWFGMSAQKGFAG